MSTEFAEFLDAYDTHRVRGQERFYDERAKEYERSSQQISLARELLLLLAAASGVVAAAWTDGAVWLGVSAAAFSAVAAAVTSWGLVIGFSANAELYRAARAGLARLRPNRPDAGGAAPEQVRKYFDDVEDILMGEVRTWSQKWTVPSAPGSET
jgi:hypothetical protein